MIGNAKDRAWDKRFDGHRFCFMVSERTGYTTIKDELGEFENAELPNGLSKIIAMMLNDLHELQIDSKTTTGNLKSLIQIAEGTELDKDVLITCIKYGMDYNKDKRC